MEKEVLLPPMTKEVVLLDLDEMGALTYNVLQSLIAVNAVDSERKDQVWFRCHLSGHLNSLHPGLSLPYFGEIA